MASPKILDRDRGYAKLMQVLKGGVPKLKVGVFGAGASAMYENGATTGDVAEIHEFGRGNNPERSWMRGYVDANRGRLEQMTKRIAHAVVTGKATPEQALQLLGVQIVGEIKQRIVAGIPPALAASTLRQKGEDKATPLINSGQVLGSITHEVVPAGAK